MSELRSVSPGFTEETWKQFDESGFLVLSNRLPESEVASLRTLISGHVEARQRDAGFDARHIVETHPLFANLIDHDAYIGFVHDVYGESLKLLLSQFFVRPPGQTIRNDWHFDGPRQVPFQVFAPNLPLRIKVGIWLTDLPSPEMGNLIFVPGSHRDPYLDQYKTQERHLDEVALCLPAGSMTLMASGLWHRVDENRSQRTRMNVFMEYGPCWMTASDRWRCNLAWLESLNREQRILMRDYEYPNALIKPPQEDAPLFLPRQGEDPFGDGKYRDHVPLSLRKHRTWLEQKGFV